MTKAVLIVDDEPLMQARLRRILATLGYEDDALVCVVNVAECKAASALSGGLALALIDLGLPDGSGIELISWLRARADTLPILVISAWSTEEMILGALRAGASGYLLKERDDTEIAASLKNVLKGGAPIDPFIAWRILHLIGQRATSAPAASTGSPDAALREVLSERERTILVHVADGLSNREIADALAISKSTVDTHIHHIYRKLAVKSRTQALREARVHGLLR